jgi:hypothetical protein
MKRYLGNDVYAEFTGEELILMTEEGIMATNIIHLDLWVIDTLEYFIKEIKKEIPSKLS